MVAPPAVIVNSDYYNENGAYVPNNNSTHVPGNKKNHVVHQHFQHGTNNNDDEVQEEYNRQKQYQQYQEFLLFQQMMEQKKNNGTASYYPPSSDFVGPSFTHANNASQIHNKDLTAFDQYQQQQPQTLPVYSNNVGIQENHQKEVVHDTTTTVSQQQNNTSGTSTNEEENQNNNNDSSSNHQEGTSSSSTTKPTFENGFGFFTILDTTTNTINQINNQRETVQSKVNSLGTAIQQLISNVSCVTNACQEVSSKFH